MIVKSESDNLFILVQPVRKIRKKSLLLLEDKDGHIIYSAYGVLAFDLRRAELVANFKPSFDLKRARLVPTFQQALLPFGNVYHDLYYFLERFSSTSRHLHYVNRQLVKVMCWIRSLLRVEL